MGWIGAMLASFRCCVPPPYMRPSDVSTLPRRAAPQDCFPTNFRPPTCGFVKKLKKTPVWGLRSRRNAVVSYMSPPRRCDTEILKPPEPAPESCPEKVWQCSLRTEQCERLKNRDGRPDEGLPGWSTRGDGLTFRVSAVGKRFSKVWIPRCDVVSPCPVVGGWGAEAQGGSCLFIGGTGGRSGGLGPYG